MRIRKGNRRSTAVEVLVLTSQLDLSTDRICLELASGGTEFLRLNRETLPQTGLTLLPVEGGLRCRKEGREWSVGPDVKSVWWRHGTFDRNISGGSATIEEQMERSQWSAFMRSLMALDGPVWVNDPAKVYKAEIKAFQLRQAAKIGFNIPPTLMTNDPDPDIEAKVGADIALKSVDTLLLREDEEQLFGYTSLRPLRSVATEQLRPAPATIQSALRGKLDLRVTVIGNRQWCVSIKSHGSPIDGDWRLGCKSGLEIDDYDLPPGISKRCIDLVHALGLRYGAIDLAFADGRYWFIEINPTGEWGWLDRSTRPIAAGIAGYLTCPY